jgi:hypothetical protein
MELLDLFHHLVRGHLHGSGPTSGPTSTGHFV